MEKKGFILIIYILVSIVASSQNLISNGGFENYTSLPTSPYQSYKAIGWTNVNGVYSGPPYGSPDYYHTLSFSYAYLGSITPNGGNGQMGFYTYSQSLPDSREYISAQLNSTLIVGQYYQLTFYLTSGFGGAYDAEVDNFGVHFSNSPLVQNTDEVILVTPQIEIPGTIYHSNYWQQYTFTFFANSSSNYITFGNFELDVNTTVTGGQVSYYFIDDIELITIPPPLQIQGDIELCLGDSTTLLAVNDIILGWADSLNPSNIISTNSTLTISPLVTTTYFVYGANDTTSVTVNVYNSQLVDLGNDRTLCQGQIITLGATITNATYLWQDNSTNPTFKVTQQGIYWSEVTINNCSTTDTILVIYNQPPAIDLGNDTTLCQGDTLILDATATNATYLWQDNSTNPIFNVTQQGIYRVLVTVNNCSLTETILIDQEVCEIILEIPNVFTPNNDGSNDLFVPIISKGVVSMNTIIYNRWGSEIFETNKLLIEWDGQDISEGTYFWVVCYTDINGVQNNLKGHVTILR